MEQLDPMGWLVGFDRDDVIDREELRRAVLPDRMQADLDASQFEAEHRQDAFRAFDEAGREGAEEEFDRVEGVGSPGEVGVRDEAGFLRSHQAAVAVEAVGADVVFKHGRSVSGRASRRRRRGSGR
jgi:hypothetical protein